MADKIFGHEARHKAWTSAKKLQHVPKRSRFRGANDNSMSIRRTHGRLNSPLQKLLQVEIVHCLYEAKAKYLIITEYSVIRSFIRILL